MNRRFQTTAPRLRRYLSQVTRPEFQPVRPTGPSFGRQLRRALLRVFGVIRGLPGFVLTGERVAAFLRVPLALLTIWGMIWFSRMVSNDVAINPISLWSAAGWRYWVFPLAAFLGGFLLVGNYIRLVYQVESFRLAFQKLAAAVFGLFLPVTEVANGGVLVDEGEENLVVNTGGPGLLTFRDPDAAMLESLTEPRRAVGGPRAYVSRYELLRDVVTLRDQDATLPAFIVTSKDGIETNVINTRFRYRLRLGRQPGDFTNRSPEQPFPFTPAAVRRAAYRRNITSYGVTPWTRAVALAFDGAIRDYINEHLYDEIKAPEFTDPDPRETISRNLMARAARDRMRELGAELLWFDIGHFDPVLEDVDEQFVHSWGAWWRGRADLQQAYADARRQAAVEQGRSEAQAEMIKAIVESLQVASLAANDPRQIRQIIQLRVAQILEALSEGDYSLFAGGNQAPHS